MDWLTDIRPSRGRRASSLWRLPYAALLTSLVTIGIGATNLGAQTLPTWSELPFAGKYPDYTGGRYGHVCFYEPLRKSLYLYGGLYGGRQSLVSLDLYGGQWRTFGVPGAPFTTVYGALGVDVPSSDELVVFGGNDGAATNTVVRISLQNPSYTVVATQGTPPSPRWYHCGIYDPIRRRLIAFGGYDASTGFLNDLWQLSLGSGTPTWSPLVAIGTPPSPRDGASMIYDPQTDSAVLYGGNLNGVPNGEVWRLSLSGVPQWVLATPTGDAPPPRAFHAAVLDSATHSMIVFGGFSGVSLSDAWTLSLDGSGGWSPIVADGIAPEARHSLGAVFDPVQRRLVAFGGRDEAANTNPTDVPTLDLSSPSPHWVGAVSQPGPRYGATAVYDPIGDRLLVYGGARDLTGTPAEYGGTVWQLDMTGAQGWSAITFSNLLPQPSTRIAHQSFYDPVRARMIVVGGYSGSFSMDVWALSLQGTPTWSKLQPAGPAPVGRDNFVAAYDSKRDRILIMGGNNGHDLNAYMNDVWALPLSGPLVWQQLAPAGTPPQGRMGHTGAYDADGDRLLVFSGLGNTSPTTPLGDAWALSLDDPPQWQPLASSPQRIYESLVVDPEGNRMIVFGGEYFDAFGDVYQSPIAPPLNWSNVGWSTSASPAGRFAHAAAFDTKRNRMVVYGGTAYGGPLLSDTWFLTWPTLATTLALTTSRSPELVNHTVTLTAHISPAISGTVDFLIGPTPIGTATLAAGSASLDWMLPGTPASYTIAAQYAGSTHYLPSSALLAQAVVLQYPTALAISSSANPSTLLTVTLTAQLSPAGGTGSVAFSDDSGYVATVSLVNGLATLPYHARSLSDWHITAAYLGSANYAPCTTTFLQRYTGVATTTSLTSSLNPVTINVPVTLTANVQPVAASGSVAFYDGASSLGSVALDHGVATISWQTATAGDHQMSAVYSGDTTYSSSQGGLEEHVLGDSTVTTLTVSCPISGDGDLVRLTATIQPPAETGSVMFILDGRELATVAVAHGSATWVTSALGAGASTITAWYKGSALYSGSMSPPLPHFVSHYLPNVMHVLWPNNGETATIGSTVPIEWNAVSHATLGFVSIYVSRNDGLPEWELLDGHVPNTGSYAWTVTGPGSATARIAVIDLTGRIGSDASDLTFSIVDVPTATLATKLEAEPSDSGIRVSWNTIAAASLANVTLERAPAETGPWVALAMTPRTEADLSFDDDTAIEAGTTYWYRLVGTLSSGAPTVFGPVSATAGAPLEFALSAPWPNPSRGAVSVRLVVPRPAHVRVSVMDVQGREITVLADSDFHPGTHPLSWDGRTPKGRAPNGVYFVRCVTPGRVFVARVAIVA